MNADFLTLLRCPLDPARDATLARDDQHLFCDRCAVRFPCKLGVPNLDPQAAELPAPLRELSQLACRKSTRRR